MAGFGFGFGAGTRSAAFPPPSMVPFGVEIAPSAGFNGTAGSGFGEAYGVVPVDPTRTTAKPACRLLTPPNQSFTDHMLVGVLAMANDSGSLLDNLGLEKVIVHFEGRTAEILMPSWQTFASSAGDPVTYFGWWCFLKHGGVNGHGRVYFEAVPKDASMQRRVIGPFTFSAVTTRYDRELAVTPSLPEIVGSRYQTLNTAVQYAKTQGDQNPLITITEAGTYAMLDSSPTAYNRNGYCHITASVPGVVIGYPDPPTPSIPQGLMECARLKLHLFGPNLTLDYANFGQFQGDLSLTGHDHWFDGITMTNTNGRESFFQGRIRTGGLRVRGAAWFTECIVSDLEDPLPRANLIRGCTCSRLMNNCVNAALAVVQSTFDDHSTGFFNNNDPAFTVVYTGTEAIATIAKRGGAQGLTRGDGVGLYRVTIGSTVHDFEVGDTNSGYWAGTLGDGFTFGDVVAWLNTLPDISAALVISDDRAASTGGLGPNDNGDGQFGTKGQGWGFPSNATTVALDIKTVKTITSYFDFHGDWYQHGTGTLENVIVWGNRVWGVEGQIVFLSPTGGSPIQRDMFFVGNGFHRPDSPITGTVDGEGNASQWGRPGSGNLTVSHVVLAHNSWAGQRLLLRGGSGNVVDSYSILKNCAMPTIGADTVGWAGVAIDGVHLRDASIIPAIGTNYSTGGASSLDFYSNASAGDFTPIGPLLDNLSAPVVAFDLNRNRFAQLAPRGALSS